MALGSAARRAGHGLPGRHRGARHLQGVVIFAGWQGGYGYKVEIRHWDGTVSYYGHNSKLKVTEGQSVATGQLIALSGNTGHSTGPHLHLEIHPNGGGPVPPAPWMKARGAAL